MFVPYHAPPDARGSSSACRSCVRVVATEDDANTAVVLAVAAAVADRVIPVASAAVELADDALIPAIVMPVVMPPVDDAMAADAP